MNPQTDPSPVRASAQEPPCKIAEQLREAVTVLDEAFHREAVGRVLEEAADRLERLEAKVVARELHITQLIDEKRQLEATAAAEARGRQQTLLEAADYLVSRKTLGAANWNNTIDSLEKELRQQAEQALQAKFDVLDEQWGHYPASFASLMDSIDSKSLEAGVENFVLWHSKKREAAESRVAALTQALKDTTTEMRTAVHLATYEGGTGNIHADYIEGWANQLDAALTGAQA